MGTDIDYIISLMKEFTPKVTTDELGEQDTAAPATGTGDTGEKPEYPTVTKWETGLTRSVANTIDDKVTWKSLNKLVRGKGNTLL